MSNSDKDTFDDDFEEDDDEGFEDFSDKQTLGDLWRNNPFVKLGVVLAGFAVIVGGIILFGSGEEPPAPSFQPSGPEVAEAPGVSEISEEIRRATEERNRQLVERAQDEQESALPIPIGAPRGEIPLEEPVAEEDPLKRWREIQEQRIRERQAQTERAREFEEPEPQPEQRDPRIDNMASLFQEQMQQILETKVPEPSEILVITSPGFLEDLNGSGGGGGFSDGGGGGGGSSVPASSNILIEPGKIEYGQLLLEANTDAPGPVLASVLSGPLSGARLLGQFSATDEYITLNFSVAVLNQQSIPVNAIAIDPATTRPGVITEIDRKLFRRVFLPAAASFVEGLGEAVSDSGTTNVTVEGDIVTSEEEDLDVREEIFAAVEDAGETLGEILEEEGGNLQPMLRVAQGTPIGILFLQPVTR